MQATQSTELSLLLWLRMLLAELWRVIRYDPPELLEAVMGAGAVYWGLWLIAPAASVTAASAAAGNLLTSSTEVYWGAVFVIVGLFKVAAVIPLWPGRPVLRQLASGMLLFLWSFVAYQFHQVNAFGTGTANYSWLALVQIYLFWRQVSRARS